MVTMRGGTPKDEEEERAEQHRGRRGGGAGEARGGRSAQGRGGAPQRASTRAHGSDMGSPQPQAGIQAGCRYC